MARARSRAAQAVSSPACVQATGASTEGAVAVADGVSPDADADADTQDFRRECHRTWARLIQRVYEVNPLICPDRGSTLEVVAFIDTPATIQKILQYLHLWGPARASASGAALGKKGGRPRG